MAGVGEGAGTIGAQAGRETGDEAALQVAGEAPVELAEDLGRSAGGRVRSEPMMAETVMATRRPFPLTSPTTTSSSPSSQGKTR